MFELSMINQLCWERRCSYWTIYNVDTGRNWRMFFCGLSVIGNRELLEVFEIEISRVKHREDYNIVVGCALSKLCHAKELDSQLRPTC